MSNIAGKAYAINFVTPIRDVAIPLNKLLLWTARRSLHLRQRDVLSALPVHFARWLLLRDRDLPRVSAEQPRERLRHGYLLVFGTIHCSLQQWVEQVASVSPGAFSWLCFGSPGWKSSPATRRQTLQRNVARNQIWTDYFYSSYPLASADDIRSAERVKRELGTFLLRTEDTAPAEFMREYHALLKTLQGDLGLLSAKSIASLAARDQPSYAPFETTEIPDDTDVYRGAVSQRVRIEEPATRSERRLAK